MHKKELIDKLRRTEETLLLELLDINSEELVDMFLDKIEDNIERLYRSVGDD